MDEDQIEIKNELIDAQDELQIKEELNDHLKKFCQARKSADLDVESSDYDIIVPSELKECELEGLHWIAGIGDCSK